MRTKLVLISALAALALSQSTAFAARGEFESIHALVNPSMATRQEMEDYRRYVDAYVDDLEEEIQHLRAKQGHPRI